jgi:tetratricopeptide (TPR) repeat protein
MRSQDQRRPPLPVHLTSAEREFYTELRRLTDVSGMSADELSGTAAGESACEDWLNGQSLPSQRAVRELASKLTASGVDAGRLAGLWMRAFLPTSYPAEPGRSPVHPRQLPIETSDFTGRSAELKVLEDLAREAAASGEATVIVIEGPAATGKTALANHVAHQLTELFPDGQLWADLRGFGDADEPVTDGQALRGFLEAIGAGPGELPHDADERAALYQRLLTGRRVLVVLDNARDAGQVRRLLPASPACLALITTRALPADLAGDLAETGAHVLRLGPLSDSEVRDLLESRVGIARLRREPGIVRQLGSMTGRLPLVLNVAAALAAADPDLSLQALAEELRSGSAGADDPLAIARTVFAASCAHLSDGAARMFRLLSVGPGPDIGLPAAASLAAIPAEAARGVLHELTTAYLVEEHQPDRFIVHDLPRRYAAESALANEGAAELHAATRRLLDYSLRGMHAAVGLIYPARPFVPLVPPMAGVQAEIFGSSAEALAWCRAERPGVQALVRYAAGQGDFGAYCWQLPWAMAPLLARGGFRHDYLALQRIAVATAADLGDPLGQGIANYEYAHACALLGEVGDSGVHLKEALQWFTKAGDRLRAARTLNGMAQLLMQEGEYRRALDREQEALELRRAVGDPDEIAHSEQTIGSICARLGRHDEAVRHCQHSLDLSRETGSRALTADTLATLGVVHLSLGDYGRAVACYMEVLVIYREIGDKAGTAEALTGLGDAQHASGDLTAARAAWRQALTILTDVPSADVQPIQARLGPLG